MELAVVVVCGLLGLAAGPGLTTIAWRTARRDQEHPEGAACPRCHGPVARADQLPVISWLGRRGRCRSCGEPFGVWYPLTEVAAGLILAATGARFGLSWALPAYLVVAASFVALTVTDLQRRLLPNRIIYPTGFVVGPLLVLAALADGQPLRIAGALGGGAATFLVFFLLHLIRPDGMAFGDVRLSFLVGLALGWIAPSLIPVALLAAFLASAVIGLGYGAVTRRWLKATIPFGPFLTIATEVVILASTSFRSPWSVA